MEINVENSSNHITVKLNGRLDTNTSQELENTLTDSINKGNENILIDCTELDYISSSGLRVFLVAAKTLDEKNKKLNFCGMKDYIKEVFEIAGFIVLFNFYNTCEEYTV
jgi:anti-sigma B factor antagonist